MAISVVALCHYLGTPCGSFDVGLTPTKWPDRPSALLCVLQHTRESFRP